MTLRRHRALLAALGLSLARAATARAQMPEQTPAPMPAQMPEQTPAPMRAQLPEQMPAPVPAQFPAQMPTPMPAQTPTQLIEVTPEPPLRPPIWEITAGVRTVFIKDPGFDPFSSNDGFVQFSLSGTRAIVRNDRLAFVAGIGLDVGSSSATARNAPSSLSLTRLSALAEGRYQPWQRFYLFARLAPGLLHGTATIDDGASPAGSELTASFDTFSLDAGAGAAFCLSPVGAAHIGVWLVADGGYGWAPTEHLLLAPTLGADQNKAGTLDLGTLAPRGGFFRIALALGF
jgi:hypothetical protein